MLAKEVKLITLQKRNEIFDDFYKNTLLPAILKAANNGDMLLTYAWMQDYVVDKLCQLGYDAYYYEGKVRIYWNENDRM